MKMLAIEMSSARGSLAWRSEDYEVERDWPNNRKDSGPFFEQLKHFKEKCGLPETIMVGLGPGSYAGVRIAISSAVGLQAAARARLVGFPSICAIDCDADEYCAIGDARRQSFYFARVRSNNLAEGPSLLSEKQLLDKLGALGKSVPIFCGEELPQFGNVIVRYPSALVLARIAQNADRGFALPPLEPIYLREPHITLPRKAAILND
jgi:tRNA threonylcarbamoyladenosine biosynthesis protein TsaB